MGLEFIIMNMEKVWEPKLLLSITSFFADNKLETIDLNFNYTVIEAVEDEADAVSFSEVEQSFSHCQKGLDIE